MIVTKEITYLNKIDMDYDKINKKAEALLLGLKTKRKKK